MSSSFSQSLQCSWPFPFPSIICGRGGAGDFTAVSLSSAIFCSEGRPPSLATWGAPIGRGELALSSGFCSFCGEGSRSQARLIPGKPDRGDYNTQKLRGEAVLGRGLAALGSRVRSAALRGLTLRPRGSCSMLGLVVPCSFRVSAGEARKSKL